MKICPKCNVTYDDKFKFCKKCGCELSVCNESKKTVTKNKSNALNKTKTKQYVVDKSNSNMIIAGVVILAISIILFVFSGKFMFDKKLPQAESDGTIALAPAMYNGKWGIIDKSGNWFIEPAYLSVGSFSEGLLGVLDFETKKYGFVDKNGRWVIRPQYYASPKTIERAGEKIKDTLDTWTWGESSRYQPINVGAPSFKEGFACVRFDNNESGFIDKNGNIIYSNFMSASSFKDGIAEVKFAEKNYGFIDKNGKVLCSGFEEVGSFRNGFAIVTLKKGKESYNNLSAVIDKTGNYVVKPIKGRILGPTEGYFLVTNDLKECRFIRPYENEFCSYVFREASEFSEGLSVVLFNDTICFVDKNMNIVRNLSYLNSLYNYKHIGTWNKFRDGILELKLYGEKYCLDTIWLNKQGHMVSEPLDNEIYDKDNFSDGLMPKDAEYKNYGYVNSNGEYVIQPQFGFADKFKNGVAIVQGKSDFPNETYGLIDTKGNFIKGLSKDILISTNCGLIISGKNGKIGALDSTGKNLVIPYHFDAIYTFGKYKKEDLILSK